MREKVLAICEEVNENIDFKATDLIDSGEMDSLTLVEVVSGLMEEFEVDIPFEEMLPYNFNSIDAMVALVEKYM